MIFIFHIFLYNQRIIETYNLKFLYRTKLINHTHTVTCLDAKGLYRLNNVNIKNLLVLPVLDIIPD